MNTLKPNDYTLFTQIVALDQRTLLYTMSSYLRKHYKDKVVVTSDHIHATGDIPVVILAHLDTVFPFPARDIYFDREKGVIWSPQGLGADDRAGIFAIIKLIKDGYRPHIILTTEEESGALGAQSFIAMHPIPFAETKYLIQLDRRGTNDCVFYNCANPHFISYIESFGFEEARGTFTDITVICPSWEVAGVNLSIGYQDEHSYTETFHVSPFLSTYNKVTKMLDDAKNLKNSFLYIPAAPSPALKASQFSELYVSDWVTCSGCGKAFTEYDTLPVKGKDGSVKMYCPDCLTIHVAWCDRCNEGFEIEPNEEYSPLCSDCREEMMRIKLNVAK